MGLTPLSIRVEHQHPLFGEMVIYMTGQPGRRLNIRRIDSAVANLRKQHLWDVISDDHFKAEYQALQCQPWMLEPKQAPTFDSRPGNLPPNSYSTRRLYGRILELLKTNAAN